jgi:hypothetical protein
MAWEALVAIPIELTAAQEARLRSQAQRLGVSPEVLARMAVADLLERPDPDFERAAQKVIEKNEELYRRLS